MTETVEQLSRIESQLEYLASECRRIESMWWRARLEAARLPAHRGDGALIEEYSRYTKRGTMTTLFAPLSKIERHGGMLLVEATGRVAGAVTAALCGALRKIADRALGQMHNPDAAPAGRITGVSVDPGGAITIKAQITDRPAQLKTSARVYPGISIRFDGEEIDEAALVDRDFSKLAKGVGAADTVLVKIYDRKEIAMTPLERVLRKFAGPSTGKGVRLTADERATLLAVPEISARLEALSHIELGIGDLRQRQQAEANALVVIKAAQQQLMGGPRFEVR